MACTCAPRQRFKTLDTPVQSILHRRIDSSLGEAWDLIGRHNATTVRLKRQHARTSESSPAAARRSHVFFPLLAAILSSRGLPPGASGRGGGRDAIQVRPGKGRRGAPGRTRLPPLSPPSRLPPPPSAPATSTGRPADSRRAGADPGGRRGGGARRHRHRGRPRGGAGPRGEHRAHLAQRRRGGRRPGQGGRRGGRRPGAPGDRLLARGRRVRASRGLLRRPVRVRGAVSRGVVRARGGAVAAVSAARGGELFGGVRGRFRAHRGRAARRTPPAAARGWRAGSRVEGGRRQGHAGRPEEDPAGRGPGL